MEKTKLIHFFEDLTDPRRKSGNMRHELLDIVVISICGVICGAESWEEIEEYGKMKEPWLNSFLSLPNGIPTHDTFNRVLSSLSPIEFEECFSNWVKSIIVATGHEVIAVDGKTICGAKVNGKSPIHMVSAWACTNNLVLGQVKVNEKSNEITAIPTLIEALAVQGCVITIDAMGCQTDIADKIIERKADYVLAVKGNQGTLIEEIQDEFRFGKTIETSVDEDYGHGRIETRECSVIYADDFQHITQKEKWKNMSAIVRIESTREFKRTGEMEKATRYYITSTKQPAGEMQDIIRHHWGVENKLHWTLDVCFREDFNRKRHKNAAQNFSLINKIVLNLLKHEKSCKLGMKSKRKIAGWSEPYLLKILNF